MIVPVDKLEELTRKQYPCADRFVQILEGDVPDEARRTIEYDLQLYWSDVTLDTITTALLVHIGINPAVMGHAASKAGTLYVQSDDTRPLASMTWRGDTEIRLGDMSWWISATRRAGGLHDCSDMDGGNDLGAFAVRLLPDQMLPHLPGRPLREVLSHPALDPLELTITGAANNEFYTHIRTDGQTPVRRYDLTAFLP